MKGNYCIEDITWCTNNKCTLTKCMRNPKNIRNKFIDHSFADLENKKGWCLKTMKKKQQIKGARK